MAVMEAVKVWIRTIAIIAVAAGFLEIILPPGDTQRFAKLILGFFILFAIIQPLVTMLHQNVAFDEALLTTAAAGSEDTAAVLAKGRELQQKHNQAALDQYRAAIERQVSSLAAMAGVEARAVSVELEEDASSSQYGAVRGFDVVVGPRDDGPGSVIPIGPVQIDFGPSVPSRPAGTEPGAGEEPSVDPGTCNALSETIAGYFGLKPEAVVVTAGP